MAVIKTAILQTHVYKEKSRNITQAAEILFRPELQGTDLAVLPEMFCCPYENKYFPEWRHLEKMFQAGSRTWDLSCSRKHAGTGRSRPYL